MRSLFPYYWLYASAAAFVVAPELFRALFEPLNHIYMAKINKNKNPLTRNQKTKQNKKKT